MATKSDKCYLCGKKATENLNGRPVCAGCAKKQQKKK